MRKKIEDIAAVHIANPKTAEFQVTRTTDYVMPNTKLSFSLFKWLGYPCSLVGSYIFNGK